MTRPTVFGAAYSVYVRAVRLALEGKGVPYDLVEVDVFASGGLPADYLERHPFGRIPAFEHDGFRPCETGAITRYIDEAFPGPVLQPAGPRRRARMSQAIAVLDGHAYRALVWDVFVERVRAPARRAPDEAGIAAALPRAALCLRALAGIMGEGPWLAGPALTLADLHAAPMLAYFRMAPEGEALMARHDGLDRWWPAVGGRPRRGPPPA
ncbi:MAG: glutathione S-transferase family protein, partial [Rhodospirillaceae bacterium]|nr:glutathione S-transferase family protein [Rhodospirillaceae bacterium]